jgi:tetratricopeptide (TPR) repeat protein
MFRASNDLREMAVLLNNMAVALQDSGDVTQAEEIASQALARARQAQDADTEAIVRSTLARIYLQSERLDEAAREATLADDLSQNDHGPARIASWSTLAQIAERRGDLDRADELYRLALEYVNEAGRRTQYADVALAYSELLEKRGDLAGAVRYAREAARTRAAEVAEA